MALCTLLAWATLQNGASASAPFCKILGRPLSWDPYGAYPLQAEGKMSKASSEIVKHLQDSELGRAELLAKYRLSVDREDLVPAWALAQVLRVRKLALVEYRSEIRGHGGDSASLPVRLYRFHVCRLAFKDLLENHRDDPGQSLYWSLDKDLRSLREGCREAAKKRLGVAIGLTNSIPFWVIADREILQAYQGGGAKKLDVRPLLCRAFLNGVVAVDHKEIKPVDAPNPEKALQIARSILKDRPGDPFGLYYSGRSLFALRKVDAAIRDVRAALATNKLPSIFEDIARCFLDSPSESAFYSVRPVD